MRRMEKMPPTMTSMVWLLLCITTMAHVTSNGAHASLQTGFSNLGEPCVYDEECETLTTFCRERRICACKDRFREKEGRCVATVGARCRSIFDCTTLQDSECDTEASECVCRDGYVRHSSYTSCLPVVTVYKGPCQETEQCQKSFGDYANCWTSTTGGLQQQYCRCMDGYHFAEGKCHHSKGLGDTCTENADCSYDEDERNRVHCQGANAAGRSGTCECREGFRRDDRVCLDGASQASISLLAFSAMIMVKFILG